MTGLRTESRSTVSLACTTSRFTGKCVHFIGIGGSGMSGLARMLLDDGAIVSGSEPNPNPQTNDLEARGVQISRQQTGELLSGKVDLVVRTAAVPNANPEYLLAQQRKIPSIKYAQLLGEVMAERTGVAVAGTHGKSTTSAMISYALLKCGAEPSFIIGGSVPQLGGGSRSGKSDLFVAEACEYDRSFHSLRPRIALITNIEEDHLDCYKDIGEIVQAFRTFAELVPDDGGIVANGVDLNVRQALDGLRGRVEWVGPVKSCNWRFNLRGFDSGLPAGEIFHQEKLIARIRLSVPGEHNLFNAAMAIAACAECGVDPQRGADAVASFAGVERRMSEIGKFRGAIIVDDYGHHPTEIRATLKALRERYAPKRLLCVFQPHQHSRTRFLLEDFASSFAMADETIVPDIYFVRDSEAERHRVSSFDLVQRIEKNGHRARHLPEFSAIVDHLRKDARHGDLIVTMGAGNVWQIGRSLVGES